MRLTPQEIDAIRAAARQVFGDQADVLLFGSRVDDRKRGGDIDLLVRAQSFAPGATDRFLDVLEATWGEERRVDVVLLPHHAQPGPLERLALATAVPILEARS